MPKVSVILPVHNVEKFLPHALDSLKEQSMEDAEFICVNNNTVDKSPEIIKSYADNDKRFIFLDLGNISPNAIGLARNEGIRQAKGEYIAFLDPDDTLRKDALEKLYSQAKTQNTDVTVFNYRKMDEDYNFNDEFGNPIGSADMRKNMEGVFELSPEKTFRWQDVKPKLFGGFFWAAWNKFFKRDFLKKNDIHFTTNCNRCEDCEFVLGSLIKARKIGFNDNYLYNYMKRKNSATNTSNNPDNNFSIFNVINAVRNVIRQKGLTVELGHGFDEYSADMLTGSYSRVLSKDKFIKRCNNELSDSQKSALKKRETIPIE